MIDMRSQHLAATIVPVGSVLETGKFELDVKMDFVRGVIGMWVTFFGTNNIPMHPIHLSGP